VVLSDQFRIIASHYFVHRSKKINNSKREYSVTALHAMWPFVNII